MTATTSEVELELHRGRVVTISSDLSDLSDQLRAVYWHHIRVEVLVPDALAPDLHLADDVMFSAPVAGQGAGALGGRNTPGPTRPDLLLRRFRAIVRDNARPSSSTLLRELAEALTAGFSPEVRKDAAERVVEAFALATERERA